MSVNVERLRAVLEHITAHPEEWNQETWAQRTPCGTAFCLAGHTVVMAGLKVDWDDAEDGVSSTVKNGSFIDEVATELLGLDSGASMFGHQLFAPYNTLADLWRIAGELTGGEIAAPPEVTS